MGRGSIDEDAIRRAVEAEPGGMTMVLARRLGVAEVEVVRRLPDGRAVELDASRWEEIVRAFEGLGPVHVIVSNGATTIEVSGRFGGFSRHGPFFNVQTPRLDLHLRGERIGSIFAVRKPSHLDGVPTLSIQFFDREGEAALKVFLNFGDHPTDRRRADFDRLRESFECSAAGASRPIVEPTDRA